MQELIVALARKCINKEKVKTLLEDNIEINILKKELECHKLSSVAYYHIAQFPTIRTRFFTNEKAYDLIKLIIDSRYEESRYVQSLLHKYNIETIILKGPAYSENIYENKYFRFFADVDFLIHTDNAIKAHRILLNNGYIVCNPEKEEYNEEHLSNRLEQWEHLFVYLNQSTHFNIEFHHAFGEEEVYKYIWANNIHVNGLRIPDIIGSFFMACFHAYQHADHAINSLEYLTRPNRLTLRELTDIYESYNAVVECNKMHIIHNILKSSTRLMNYVAIVLEYTKFVYTDFVGLDLKTPTSLVWKSNYYVSDPVDRLFEPVKESARLYSLYNEYIKDNEKQYICKKWNPIEPSNEPICFSTKYIEDGYFWDTHIYASRYLYNHDTNISFNTYWSNKKFHIYLEIVNSEYDVTNFNDRNISSNFIMLGFGNDYDSKPVKVLILLNKYKNHNIMINNIVYQEADINVVKITNGYKLIFSVPWELLMINPQCNHTFLFELSVGYGNLADEMVVNWAGGRGSTLNHMHDCLTFGRFVFVE